MKILCVFGEYNYGDRTRGQSYEFTNFIPALRALGHEVRHFESWDRSCYSDFAALNRALLTTVELEQPDFVFVVLMHYEVWLETIDEVRHRCRVPVINWGTDDSWKYEQFARWVAPVFDVYVTTYAAAMAKSRRDGLKNFHLSQWAASSAYLREPLPAVQCRYPVSFVGSAYGNRPRWIAGLRKAGIEVYCFGHGWERGPVGSEDIPEIIRNSVISLNFGDSGVHLSGLRLSRSRQIKARIFEVPGAGGFLLTENATNLSRYYNLNQEIAIFEGVRDLRDKIRHFLDHPLERDVIARAGYERTRREHTYEQRFGQFLSASDMSGQDREMVRRENDCRFDGQWFRRLEALHRPGPWLRLLKWFLVRSLSVFYGARRGARAARRIVFEISWRFGGARTYRAAGIPGRLFYRES